jgi:diadenosine tetraphosphate (Ap4A) HIT family hydrolase
MIFELHPNLSEKIFIRDLPLCRLLMEDDKHYPWFFLVPRVAGVSRIMDLSRNDQLQLLKELDFVQKAVWQAFHPHQINVAAIGNKTPQLHVHVIARYEDDPAWPGTVWDHSVRTKCSSSLLNERRDKILDLTEKLR